MSFNLDDYDFELDESRIAQHPADPKESAKLLIYDRKRDHITHATIGDLCHFIPESTHILLNDTRVVKARIFGKKASGGKIELLFQQPTLQEQFLVNIRGRVQVGTFLYFDHDLSAEVLQLNTDGTRIVRFFHHRTPLDFHTLLPILEAIGHIPLPPYIKRSDNAQDHTDYQTVFAKEAGAVAAPTASLHFSDTLFKTLQQRYALHYLTLHVGIFSDSAFLYHLLNLLK